MARVRARTRLAAPDDKERTGAGIADALQRRGIAVAIVSFGITDAHPFPAQVEVVAGAIKELAGRAGEYGFIAEPVLAGDELGASLVAQLALDPRFGFEPAKLRGVIAMNGVYVEPKARADAPPFMVLSAHGDAPASAQSSRALVRALERAGAKRVHGYHASTRDARSLTNLSGDHNDVGDLVAAFVRGEPTPGGAESTWALERHVEREGADHERAILEGPAARRAPAGRRALPRHAAQRLRRDDARSRAVAGRHL